VCTKDTEIQLQITGDTINTQWKEFQSILEKKVPDIDEYETLCPEQCCFESSPPQLISM